MYVDRAGAEAIFTICRTAERGFFIDKILNFVPWCIWRVTPRGVMCVYEFFTSKFHIKFECPAPLVPSPPESGYEKMQELGSNIHLLTLVWAGLDKH